MNTTTTPIPRIPSIPRPEFTVVTTPGPPAFWRPRSLLVWAYLGSVAFGVFGVVNALQPFGTLSPWVLVSSVAVNGVLTLLLLMLIMRLDVFRATPAPLLTAAFVWGASAAIGVALEANSHVSSLVPKLLGTDGASVWNAAITGPTSEEWVKTAGVVAVILIGRHYVRRPSQGFVLGALCGLGFQVVEDLTYAAHAAFEHPDSDMAGAGLTLGLRTFAGFTSHWMYSALCGLGIAYALIRRDRSRRRRAQVAICLAGMGWAAHFLWNSQVLEHLVPQPVAPVMMPVKIALISVAFFFVCGRAIRAEWPWFAAAVRAEHPAVIAPFELESLPTSRSRRKVRKYVRKNFNRKASKSLRRLQRVQLRLGAAVELDPPAADRIRRQIMTLRAQLDTQCRR